MHLLSQLEHTIIWNNSFFFDVLHDYPRKVKVFEGLAELMVIKMGQLIVYDKFLEVVNIANYEIAMSNVNLLFHLISHFRYHNFLTVLSVNVSPIMIAMIVWTFQVSIAFLVFTWFCLVIKRVILRFFPTMTFQTSCL